MASGRVKAKRFMLCLGSHLHLTAFDGGDGEDQFVARDGVVHATGERDALVQADGLGVQNWGPRKVEVGVHAVDGAGDGAFRGRGNDPLVRATNSAGGCRSRWNDNLFVQEVGKNFTGRGSVWGDLLANP